MSTLSAAVAAVERGWSVFPCDQRKRPKTANGVKNATTDVELVRDHWVQHPDDCIGIATGNGLVVIDVDSYKDQSPTAEWLAIVAELPPTYTVRTGQGGLQFYFTTVLDVIHNSAGKLAPNVDVRGKGGYVIGAGSVTIYGEYVHPPDLGEDLAPLPDWIVERLARKAEPVASTDAVPLEDLTEDDRNRLAQYAARAYEAELQRLRDVREGARNQTTYEVACNLLEIANSGWNDLTEADALNAVLEAAPIGPDFEETEALAAWNSARKTTEGKTRPVPPRPSGGGYVIQFEDGEEGRIDPDSFFDQGRGLNTTRLASAIMSLGPLAVDDTDNRGIWAYSAGVWRRAPNVVGDRCVVLLGGRFRTHTIVTMEKALRTYCSGRGQVITCEPVPQYINVRNGMLDWRTGELVDHAPEFYSTVQLPVEWDPTATCPGFDQFAKEVMADDAIEYLWEILGYLVYSGNPYHRAILFHGDGGNGKGTLLRVIEALLGHRNTSSVTLQDITDGKFEVAEIYGKIANLAGDIDATYLKSTAKFKAVTGQDKLSAQRKFESPFQFTCWAVPVFSANKLWRSVDNSTGYHRRWLLLSFPNTFTGSPDSTLSDRLIREAPGVLAKAVQGLQRLMARGDFEMPTSALREKEEFEQASDQVREWLEDDPSIVTADPRNHVAYVNAANAYAAYRSWAMESGTGQVASKEFRQRLAQAGYVIRKVGTHRIYGLDIDRQLRHLASPDYSSAESLRDS